jgi:CHAT domain-containing protein
MGLARIDARPSRYANEGIMTVRDAKFPAGVATLWSVSDSSTALLMRTLYQAHKDDHLTKADALRHAQLALLHGSVHADPTTKSARGLTRVAATPANGSFKTDPDAPFAHPFFWAPFILMGNWL